MEQPNYYAVIPANVRYSKDLTDKAKLLYGEIVALCNKNGVCTASNSYFAKLYDVNTTTISTLINSLVKNGFVKSEIIYKEGTKEIQNRYLKIPKDPHSENSEDPSFENSKDPLLKNQKENNTSINNIKEIYKENISGEETTAETNANNDTSSKKETKEEYMEKLKYNFNIIWSIYPRKEEKETAFKHYKAWIEGKKSTVFGKKKLTNEEIYDAVENYNKELQRDKTERRFVKMGSTFFNNGLIDYLPKEDDIE